jgi:ribosomal protein L37AE/L43A
MTCPFCGKEDHPSEPIDACPGDCNRAWVNAERVGFEEAKSRRPRLDLVNHGVPMIEAAPVWCRECQEQIVDAINGFPAQCKDLTPGFLNISKDAATGPHSTAVIPPSPSPAWDTADEIIRWAVCAEDDLRARIGDPGRGPRPWRTLGSAVFYLVAHATPLLSSPDAVSIGFEALRMSKRLTKVTGSDRLVHRLPGECLVCDRKSLQREDGNELVKCKACGATWYWGQYEFLAKAHADKVRAG